MALHAVGGVTWQSRESAVRCTHGRRAAGSRDIAQLPFSVRAVCVLCKRCVLQLQRYGRRLAQSVHRGRGRLERAYHCGGHGPLAALVSARVARCFPAGRAVSQRGAGCSALAFRAPVHLCTCLYDLLLVGLQELACKTVAVEALRIAAHSSPDASQVCSCRRRSLLTGSNSTGGLVDLLRCGARLRAPFFKQAFRGIASLRSS